MDTSKPELPPDTSRKADAAVGRSPESVNGRDVLLEAEIRSRAYIKWEMAGCPILNTDEDRHAFWFAAEREVLQRKAIEAERQE